MFSQMREGGVGEIVFLSLSLRLFCHICCFFWDGVRVWRFGGCRALLPPVCASVSGFTQSQASLAGDRACFRSKELKTKWSSCCWSAVLRRRDDDCTHQYSELSGCQSKCLREGVSVRWGVCVSEESSEELS